jgi:hypothetical protein
VANLSFNRFANNFGVLLERFQSEQSIVIGGLISRRNA